MKLPGPPIPQHHLNPGQLIFTRKPSWILTLLGSCVAVTMFNERLPLAGICHGMLPDPPHDAKSMQAEVEPYRYLSRAIPAMVKKFREAGVEGQEIEVKLFGGANVIQLGGEPMKERWIGTANVDMARQLLQQSGLAIRAENVGGELGCKIIFNTQTGEVLHKFLKRGATT